MQAFHFAIVVFGLSEATIGGRWVAVACFEAKHQRRKPCAENNASSLPISTAAKLLRGARQSRHRLRSPRHLPRDHLRRA